MAETVDKDESVLLRQKPSLKVLQNIVVPRVSSKWKTVGLNLNIKYCRLEAIEESKHYQTDDCCTEMFSIWLNLAPHTGNLPLTWKSVLSAIEKVERVTSEELLAELKSNAGDPLLQDATHQESHKLAAELKSYYGRLEPVAQDRYTPKLDFVQLAVVECEKYRTKETLEDFLHAAVNGIDDIYQKSSTRVEYCEILKLDIGTDTGKRIIISGVPGSGKTTLVRQLCKDLVLGNLPSDYTLVVLVELRELILLLKGQEEVQLHHFLTKFEHKVDISQVCKELEKSDGKGMLLVLDGFDELDARMKSCQLLKKLLSIESNYLPECDILVTSRPVTCPDLLELMQPLHGHIEILGFSESCIASFVRNYFKCLVQPSPKLPPTQQLLTRPPPSQPPATQPPFSKALPSQQPPSQPASSQPSVEGVSEAEKLLSRLDQLPQVKGMCRTPVVLNIVCKVCRLLGADGLPATMTGIYEKFIIRQLLANAPDVKGHKGTISSILRVPTSEYPFFNDLCKIAFECCTKQKLIISKEDITEAIPPSIRGSIYGLLDEDPVEDIYALELVLYHFMHKTVQEALAACHVAMLPNSKCHLTLWQKWFGRPEMAEVWKFYCGLTKLKHVDICSILQSVDWTSQDVCTLLVVSLFEAGNSSLARDLLPRIFPAEINATLSTPYETAAFAFAVQHQMSLVKLHLTMADVFGTVNLQPLLDALSCHPTARKLTFNSNVVEIAANDIHSLCQFLRGKHRLAEIGLVAMPIMVVEAALSAESSTMKELEWIHTLLPEPEEYNLTSLADSLRSSTLKGITISGYLDDMLLPILRGFAANTNTVDRTVDCRDPFVLDTPLVSLLPELKRFLVPCVTCRLSMSLPVCLWGTLLLGVGGARRLEQLTVEMFGKPAEAGPAWDDIDQTTLEEVQKSWAHSKCTEVLFNTSSESDYAGNPLSATGIRESTLDATINLLSAAVSGIVQRKDQFVLELHVNDAQDSMLRRIKRIAKKRCTVKVTKRESHSMPAWEEELVTVLRVEAM